MGLEAHVGAMMAEDELRQISAVSVAFGGKHAKARIDELKSRIERYDELRLRSKLTPAKRREAKRQEIRAFQAMLLARGT